MDKRKDEILDYMQMQGIAKKDAEKCVNALCMCIADAMRDGDDVFIYRFGAFKARKVEARVGSLNGVKVETPEHIAVRFYPSKSLKDYVNGGTAE